MKPLSNYLEAIVRIGPRIDRSSEANFWCWEDRAKERGRPQKREMTCVAVFGGGGYVGSHILRALKRNYPNTKVLSFSRSGKPSFSANSVPDVEYLRGDLFDSTGSWASQLKEKNVTSCISCVGAFGSNDFMLKANGIANSTAMEVARQQKVAKFVYISTVENNLPDWFLSGYFQGKRQAESTLLRLFSEPGSGIVLRPSFVYGPRQVSPSLSIPLQLVGAPLEAVLSCSPFSRLQHVLPGMRAVLAPPVSVQHLAAVAAAAAMGESLLSAGAILGVEEIRSEGRRLES